MLKKLQDLLNLLLRKHFGNLQPYKPSEVQQFEENAKTCLQAICCMEL